MTPAAQNGIHAIWMAHTATPLAPNSTKLTASSSTTPALEKRV